MFTYQYHQPKEYHFSLDSIQLAEYVAEQLSFHTEIGHWRVLDLCAGCGVIGMELSWYVRALRQMDFVEVQAVYTPYFYDNVKMINRPELALHWYLLNYEALLKPAWANKYDLIISNPPYFQAAHGMLSPSEFKNRCRFYLDSSFETYIDVITHSLAVNGKAYFLLRSLKQHGYDVWSDVKALCQDRSVTAQLVTQIRGTDVVLIEKHS